MKTLKFVFALTIGFIIGVISMYMDYELNYFSSYVEYQFVVTDDSISVTDFDRQIGTVKLEGQLKELIDKDNE
jgi:hypothetical protein